MQNNILIKIKEKLKVVDESFAVKKELLSELALIMGILTDKTQEPELLSEIKRAKGSSESLFDYQIIHEEKSFGIKVSLKSAIINVIGFPLEIIKGDNVNAIVDKYVKF